VIWRKGVKTVEAKEDLEMLKQIAREREKLDKKII
jgi:hypothetical protein